MKQLYMLVALCMAVSLQGAEEGAAAVSAITKQNKKCAHKFKPRKLKVKSATVPQVATIAAVAPSAAVIASASALSQKVEEREYTVLEAEDYIAQRRGKGEADLHPAAKAAYAPKNVKGYIRYPYHPATPHEFRHGSGDGYPCKACILPSYFNPDRLGTKP